jgi:hypothetical protein
MARGRHGVEVGLGPFPRTGCALARAGDATAGARGPQVGTARRQPGVWALITLSKTSLPFSTRSAP